MDRDIDRVIAGLVGRWPAIKHERLCVSHPGADDDGLWFFTHPEARREVQVESSTGNVPFLIEGDHAPPVTGATVMEAIEIVARQLELRDPPANDR
jgi:hypothetical protein